MFLTHMKLIQDNFIQEVNPLSC